MSEVPIALAATVVVLRDAAEGGVEVLLIQRAQELVFHGGAWVFPGGRVDPGDQVATDATAEERALATARRAAVREAREEAGLALSERDLIAYSHWTTPRGRPRRFATWFFATVLPGGADVVVDGGEIKAYRWLPARAALSLQAQAALELPPPTFVTLSAIAPFASTASLLASLGQSAPPVYVPRLCGEVALYHGDAAYEGGALDAPGPRHRLHMREGGWHYEPLIVRG